MARSSVPTDVLDRMLRVRLSASRFRWLRTRTAQVPDTATSESPVLSQRRAQNASGSLEPPTCRPPALPRSVQHLLPLTTFDVRLSAFDVLRFALAALLLTAAGLKAYQLATEPIFETGFLHWRPLLVGIVEFELFLAVWLISGAYPRAVWWTTLLCFIGFAQITLYRAVTGEASCGCLGTVQVNPWWMFLVDATVITLLLCFRRSARRGVLHRQRLAGVVLLTLIVGVPAGAAIVHYEPTLLRLGEDPTTGRSFILLEPETWVGGKFPLFSQINIGRQLRHGRWAVLFFRHDCPKCQEELGHLEEHAEQFMGVARGYRLCVVEVPPFGEARQLPAAIDDQILSDRLTARHEWFVETPTWIHLEDGAVASVGGMVHQSFERGVVRWDPGP